MDLAIAERLQFDNIQGNDDKDENNGGGGDDDDDEIFSDETMLSWHIIFWSTFALAWFILPLAREMLLSGEFTVLTRFHDGMKKTMTGILIICAIGFCSIVWLEYHLKGMYAI